MSRRNEKMERSQVKNGKISRRTVLRGVGASVALPWLDAMVPAVATAAETGGPPVRLAFFYVPNGVNMETWRPGESGPLMELPTTLRSLEPVKDKVTVISDLAADHCKGKSAGHEPAGGGFLVGEKCKHSETPEVAGASVDQVAAREIGLTTTVDSLALGIDPGHRGDHGYSGTYLSHISWRSKTTPTPLQMNPKNLFDNLFRGQTPMAPKWDDHAAALRPVNRDTIEHSVLDLVREDAKDMQRKLGFSDRRKVEEYLDGLRGIERRIESASADGFSHHQEAFRNAPEAEADGQQLPKLIIPDGRGIPELYADHVNLMLDILTLAFQTDTTRLASFLFSYEKSGRSYPEIEVSGSHHSTSHHQSKKENLDQLTRINSHHIELFSRMLVRMSQIQEGDKTLLDNVMIVYGSGISDGNRHNHDDLPVLVAGGAGGTLSGGHHLKLGKKTPICNLYVDMLQRAGVKIDQFGDSTGGLEGLSKV
jgi:hypothetical protein